ncbi:hypothetical protein LSH36_107g02026 [Paralvinella palmiformis]|uniref:Uncharacterized protein n=1 Tax=Paralvinella palmiformis TaxID=53620 RepID=A0AAD9K0P9_9ANNE|nr:hypothetical protein LSH36_107g02026 [Paralvinella palmiformis]
MSMAELVEFGWLQAFVYFGSNPGQTVSELCFILHFISSPLSNILLGLSSPPCAVKWPYNNIKGIDPWEIKLETVMTSDVAAALLHTKPSARGLASKYIQWQKEFESV